MKKLTFLLVLTVTNGMLFAQSYSQSTNFWNTVSMDNPAMSALSNRTEANLNFNRLNFLDYYTGSALYNQKVNKLRGAIGVNSVFSDYSFVRSNRTMINYNYQWKLNSKHTLAFGGAIGFGHSEYDKNYYDSNTVFGPRTETAGHLSLGIAYHSKKLSAGIGYNSGIGLSNSYHLFTEFNQDLGENFTLSPKAMFRLYDFGYQDLNVALVGEFKKRFQLGIGTNNATNPYLVFGYRLQSGLSFNYTYVANRSKLSNAGINNYQHEFNIRFTLPTR